MWECVLCSSVKISVQSFCFFLIDLQLYLFPGISSICYISDLFFFCFSALVSFEEWCFSWLCSLSESSHCITTVTALVHATAAPCVCLWSNYTVCDLINFFLKKGMILHSKRSEYQRLLSFRAFQRCAVSEPGHHTAHQNVCGLRGGCGKCSCRKHWYSICTVNFQSAGRLLTHCCDLQYVSQKKNSGLYTAGHW